MHVKNEKPFCIAKKNNAENEMIKKKQKLKTIL